MRPAGRAFAYSSRLARTAHRLSKPNVYRIVMLIRDRHQFFIMNRNAAPGGTRNRKVRPLAIATAFAALAASAACQSSSTNIVGPGGEKCAMSLPANLPSIGAEGGTGTLQINVAAAAARAVER